MNIVIISEYATRELYVIEQILQKYPSTVVVQPTYEPAETNGKASSKLKKIEQFANRVSWKLHRELWNFKFYPDRKFPDIPNRVFIPSKELNKSTGIETINQLNPDILLTCRAPILKPEVINIPKIAALNIHYGIAPYYRGNDTLFWPLYFNDFEHLGGSIHHLEEGIDTGNVVAEVYPELKATDGEIAMDCKTTRLLAKAMLNILEAVENEQADISGKPQTIKGRNFNKVDRTIPISLKYLAKRAVGFSRPPKREERIVTYF